MCTRAGLWKSSRIWVFSMFFVFNAHYNRTLDKGQKWVIGAFFANSAGWRKCGFSQGFSQIMRVKHFKGVVKRKRGRLRLLNQRGVSLIPDFEQSILNQT